MIIDGKEKDLEVTSLPAYHVEEADRTSAHSDSKPTSVWSIFIFA